MGRIIPSSLWLLCLATVSTRAQDTTTSTSDDLYSATLQTLSSISTNAFTNSDYTYLTPGSQSTVDTATLVSIASSSQSTRTSTSASLTEIGGSTQNGTGTSTTSSATATNTVPCNGFPEFCSRSYSNITHVCAHNSAFVVPNNAGSNQYFPVLDQLNDGIRMIQGETQWANGTFHNCHTTCELLNAGTLQAEMEVVANWVAKHPYDVVTWLMVNSDFRDVEDYVPVIEQSGLRQYLYEPQYVPQRREQWPTLAEMILSGKRVVMFLDYKANQSSVPFILDEFTHMWETPFSPTDRSFPCTQQRPPHLNQTKARDEYMYLANHNLNTAVDLSALVGGVGGKKNQILIPNSADINATNSQFNDFGQLGAMTENCTGEWGRPPNFLLVDFYNYGNKPGSVFKVAAEANGVEYKYGDCCGMGGSAAPIVRASLSLCCMALAFIALLIW